MVHMGGKRITYRVLVGKPDGKSLLGRPRCRWEDNIKRYLNIIEWESIKGINLVQRRDRHWAFVCVCVVMNLQGPENTETVLDS